MPLCSSFKFCVACAVSPWQSLPIESFRCCVLSLLLQVHQLLHGAVCVSV